MSDVVVEAMARFIDPVAMRDASNDPEMVRRRKQAKDIARAAIRACHDAGGLVVGKMPDEYPAGSNYADGHRAALAAVRAAAVEVE